MGVRLTDLDARFVRSTGERGSFRRVEDMSEANGVLFACPLCFLANRGLVATHAILCWDPSVPAVISPGPGRWRLTGSGLQDVSLVAAMSSIKLESGCRWHGYVRDGECVDDLDAARVDETRRYNQQQRRNLRPTSETEEMNTSTDQDLGIGGTAAGAAKVAATLPEVEVSATKQAGHTPLNAFTWINGVLHQLFEGGPGSPPKAVPIPGNATSANLMDDIRTIVDNKLAELGPAANAVRGELETFKASVVGEIQGKLSPMIAQGISEWVNDFSKRLAALEHQANTPAPQPALSGSGG
jgi:hypothetical protein